MENKLRAGILGATGAVGQKFVELLRGHPWFEVTAVAASSRSEGKTYREAASWFGAGSMPDVVADLVVESCEPGLDCDFVFSGLDASVAGEVEEAFAAAGYPVISNARNHRMRPDVPLLIPELNPDHTALVREQMKATPGYVVTNPNCSTVGLTSALKPLYDSFGLDAVLVTTMQALSGAGYPGVASLDAVGNVVPYIGGEEEKVVSEPLKILGMMGQEGLRQARFPISAHCNRVPVRDGHTECVSVKLGKAADLEDVKRAFVEWNNPLVDLGLPSAPDPFIVVVEESNQPQPVKLVEQRGGMPVWIGRIRECEVLDFKFVLLVHNTVRGAAGGAILNAELLVRQGLLGE